MSRLLVLAILSAVAGCKRDDAWPAQEILDFETACSRRSADAPFCKCFAPAVAARVSYKRLEQFAQGGMQGPEFTDVLDVEREEAAKCGRGREHDPWPAPVRAAFIAECEAYKLSLRACECRADFAQQRVPFADYLGWMFDVRAGRPAPAGMKSLFTNPEAIACMGNEIGWDPATRKTIALRCVKELGVSLEQCECYAHQMSLEVTKYEAYLAGMRLDGGAEVTARIMSSSPKWWAACGIPAE